MTNPLRPLGEYLTLLEREHLLAAPAPSSLDPSTPIALVSCDSRAVLPNTLFICKGAHFRPEFLQMAQTAGAAAYVSTTAYPEVELPHIEVSDLRRAMAMLADLFYHHPSGKLKVLGFTGTKGKSSAAYYLKSILDVWQEERGLGETGILSSIDTYDGVERFESHLTTPEPLDLQRHFAHAVETGLPYLTMEVSSQALKYHRTLCTQFEAACFLNIGYDHISPIEHPDFEDYFASKLKLFDQAKVNCVNLDCDHAPRVLAAARAAGRPVLTFSQKDPQADVYAAQVRKEDHQTVFEVQTPRYRREFRLTMPGLFNVENALGAIALCETLQVPPSAVYAGLVRARVPGRMEVYTNGDGRVLSIVDYAHNRLSFETLFRSVKAEYPGRDMAIVFGCPGKKAVDRRRDLGRAAGQACDRIYLTEEDSGEEDTGSICREIARHVEEAGGSPKIILNRGEAIRQAVLDSTRPTVLLLTGKGRETRQKRGTDYIDTPTDVEYVQAFLQEYDLRLGLDHAQTAQSALSLLPTLAKTQGQTLVVLAPAAGAVYQDAAALSRAGAGVVLVRPEGGPLPSELEGLGVALTGADGGLLGPSDHGPVVQPKVLETLLSGGFIPVLSGGVEEAGAVAQALRAQRLVLFCGEEPSMALGENRQAELLHMDTQKARELLLEGRLPKALNAGLSLACQSVTGGAERAVLLHQAIPHILLLDTIGQQVLGLSVTP